MPSTDHPSAQLRTNDFSRGHPVSTRPVVSAEPREVVGKKVRPWLDGVRPEWDSD